MKNHFPFPLMLSLIVASVSIISCQKSYLDPQLKSYGSTHVMRGVKGESTTNYHVSSAMARFFAASYNHHEGIASESYYINERDTLLYLFNYTDGGYVLISSDKRATPILMSSNEGSLDLNKIDNPGVRIWVEDVADQVKVIKGSNIEPEDKEMFHLWNQIEHKFNPNKPKPGTRTDTGTKGYYMPNGEWYNGACWYREIVWVDITDTVTFEINHLTTTSWGQEYPWNQKLTLTDNYYGSLDCVTGCGAVAVSQMLYYFHFNNLFQPTALYHSISTNGIAGDTTTQHITRGDLVLNSTRWNNMPLAANSGNTLGEEFVSNLMVDVGFRLRTKYSSSLSTCYSDMVIPTFNQFGITSNYSTYNESTIMTDLQNGSPCLIYSSTMINPNSSLPGHIWIIDGTRTRYLKSTTGYIWHLIDTVGQPEDPENDVWIDNYEYFTWSDGDAMGAGDNIYYVAVDLYKPKSYWLMNWGYDGDGNSGEYILGITSPWIYGNSSFQYNKVMWSGFGLINN